MTSSENNDQYNHLEGVRTEVEILIRLEIVTKELRVPQKTIEPLLDKARDEVRKNVGVEVLRQTIIAIIQKLVEFAKEQGIW